MITKTEKYKVKIDTPWIKKGQTATHRIISKMYNKVPGIPKMEDFPDMFDPIYKLEDGIEVCINDLVWREKSGVVKQVQLKQIHIDNDSKVFGTSKACEKWLNSTAKKAEKLMLEQNRESSFQTLKAWANKLNDLESLSMKDLYKIRDGIQGSISNMERI